MRQRLYSIIILLLFINTAFAQSDTIIRSGPVEKQHTKWYKTKVMKAIYVPAILIGYGVSTINDHGFYSSYQAKHDVQKYLGGAHSSIDNYLIFAPYAELAALNLLKIKCQNDFLNTSLLILKGELIMTAIVFPLKHYSHHLRPDSSDYQSFPSGHTAQAFLAASIVHKEYRYKSQWYGVGAYGIATAVGLFRMINNRHWESDVFVGAGIGILSAHIAYLTHRHRWGRKCNMAVAPQYYGNKGLGLSMSWRF